MVYDEKLNQLKDDLAKKWLPDEANATDLKKYLDEFARKHRMKPEQKSMLEDYHSSQEDFRESMIFTARKMNESGKLHIVFLDLKTPFTSVQLGH